MFMDSDVHGANGLETNKHITYFPHPIHPVGHPSCSSHGQNMDPISSPRFDAVARGKPHQPPSFVDRVGVFPLSKWIERLIGLVVDCIVISVY